MVKYVPFALLCLASSFFSVVLYSKLVPPPQVVWNAREGESKLTGVFNQLTDSRINSSFRAAAPDDFITAAQTATPAVVNIRALIENNGGLWSGGTLHGSSGSGVIMSPDGYIVTNHHVVEKSTDIKVTLSDKREFSAKLVGSDPNTDIALLKVDELNLPFILFGNSDSVRVGEWVLAVGNPFNLESTVTAGIVSAKGRNINILRGGASIESFIQTDAAVNPGNSGGALVNTLGELVGINTAIITESGSYEGYSFAVPSNLVQKTIRDLKEFGAVQRAYLGVGIQDVDSETARDLGLPNAEGVYVNRVSVHSAASDAGLKVGDVIIGVNTSNVKSTSELQEFIGRFRPGERVTVVYWRDGVKNRISLTLKDGVNSTTVSSVRGDELEYDLGFELRNLTREEKRRLGLKGVVVTSIRRGSLVYETNMQPGFIICTVNGSGVENLSQAVEFIQNAHNSLSLDGYYEGESDLYSYRFRKKK